MFCVADRLIPRKGYHARSGGEIVAVIGGRRHSSDAIAVGNRKQNARPFFARFKGVLKLKKGTPKELRGACQLFVIHVLQMESKTWRAR